MREDGETFFSHRSGRMSLDRLTRFSTVGENAAYDQCHFPNTEPASAPSRPPRSPLHLVPTPDEKAPGRRQAVRPLHLPEVRLPTHNQARPETTQPLALTWFGWLIWSIWFVLFIWLVLFNQTNRKNQIDHMNKPCYRREKLVCTLSSRIWASRSLSSGLIETIFVPNLGVRTWTTCKPQVNVLPLSSSMTS